MFIALGLVFSAMSMYGFIAFSLSVQSIIITTCGGIPLDSAKQMNVLLPACVHYEVPIWDGSLLCVVMLVAYSGDGIIEST
jgi:glucose uptake protein GlcU